MEQWEEAIKQTVNPSVPSELEDRIMHTLNQLPRQARKRKMYYALPAVVLAVVILFGARAISPVFAETIRSIPVIGSIFELVGNVGERKASQDGLVSPLGQQVVIDGKTVTFTESLYDGSSIHIGFINDTGNFEFWNHTQISIDGKRLTSYNADLSGSRTLADGSFAGIYTIHPNQEIPEAFTLELSSLDDRSWHVAIPMKLQGDEHAYLINDARVWRDMTMLYDKTVFNSTSATLSIRWFSNEKRELPSVMNYQIFDDKGRVLQIFSHNGKDTPTEDGQYVYSSQLNFERMDPIPKSLTIKPYLGSGMTGLETKRWEGKSLELSQGEAGSVRIEHIEQKNNTFTMTFEVEGELTSDRTRYVWLENQYGVGYDVLQYPQRVEGTVNQYQAVFTSTNPNDDVIIGTEQFHPKDYIDDLTITVEISK
ncbi:DUF4179 domain-containing protein [Paenibacillus sp. sptzw28]|uniref:DUF4179 domain-containing protein n=1 Tax=Paenibacillus sp. sptzw28 TaxID=715179 RepID=UPI001C6EFCFF|nr:DUF4179 domain-containing protein [Paenibacillus sp. sptzw28]QYR19142.1 DUF4179 domain-containing protein [Paenibacillus sp. sptzw28]